MADLSPRRTRLPASQRDLAGWGRFRGSSATVVAPADARRLAFGEIARRDVIARGLGRSYGDAAQNAGGTVVDTTACRGVEWLDRAGGIVRVDAGTTIGDLITVSVPCGWFVPVTPGTRNVTIGGAIAADIHGKNHHVDGSFGDHIRQLRMRLADDTIVTTGPDNDPDLFWATVGGMGLTGIVIDADIALAPIASSMIEVETSRLSLDDLMAQMRRGDALHVFSVAWVDLLHKGRSVLTQGSFASAETVAAQRPSPAGVLRRPSMPVAALPPLPPLRIAVTPGVRAFNELWYRRAPSEPTVTLETITAFFHPLDAIRNWNRVYGPGGFVQWQCVIPDADQGPRAAAAADETLAEICSEMGELPSFFTVLKRFGPGNGGHLSFPQTGWTLAVDLPATEKVLTALPRFDATVAAAGGRLYLAKDARMSRETLEAGYPRLAEWRAVRRRVDPERRFASDLSKRLGL